MQETGQYQPLMRALANGCASVRYLCHLLDMHYLDCWQFLISAILSHPHRDLN